MLAGVDRKVRIAPKVAAGRGWRVRSVSRLVVLPEDRTVRRRVVGHGATLGLAYPARNREVRPWLKRPDGALGRAAVPDSQSEHDCSTPGPQLPDPKFMVAQSQDVTGGNLDDCAEPGPDLQPSFD